MIQKLDTLKIQDFWKVYLVDIRVEGVVVVTLIAFVLKLLIQDRVKGTNDLSLELKVLYNRTVTCNTHKK